MASPKRKHSDSINDRDVRAPSTRVHTSGQLGRGQVTQGKESIRTGTDWQWSRDSKEDGFCAIQSLATAGGTNKCRASYGPSLLGEIPLISTCRYTHILLNLGTYPSLYILCTSHLWAFGHQSSSHCIYGKSPYSLKPTINAIYNHQAPPMLIMSSISGFRDRPSASLSSAV